MVSHLNENDIQRYLDHQLPAEEEQEFNHHLINCQSCQQEVKYYQEIYHFLAQEPDFQLSPEFERAVLSRLQQERKISHSTIHYDILMAILGGISAFGFIIYLYDFNSVIQTLSHFLPSLNHLWNMFKAVFTGIPGLFKSDYAIATLIILIALSFFEEHLLRKQSKSFLF